MKFENFKRVLEIKKELDSIDNALSQIEDCDGSVFLITKYRDGSGWELPILYKNGNYHPFYKGLRDDIKKRLEEAKMEIVEEIKNL